MPKLYIDDFPEKQMGNLKPRKETIAFLLNYSKALSVTDCHGMKVELLLN